MNKDEAYQLHYHWIEVCQASDRLTEWESDFIDSIFDQLQRKGELTPKQAQTLERIYAKTE